MVNNYTDRNILFGIFAVFYTCQITYRITQCCKCINAEYRVHILNNYSQTFQTHTSIDVFIFKFYIITLAVCIELGKYVVPYFHVAVAVAANGTSRFAAAVFFTTVIINFGTGTAGTCTMFPEVIFLAKTENTFCRDTHLFVPDFKCLVIIFINRRIQTLGIQTDYFCQEFPGPFDCFIFKVIAK